MADEFSTAKRNDPHALTDEIASRQAHRELPSAEELEHAQVADFQDFKILDELGRGGMGVVYKCRQLSLGRQVALKVIRGEQLGDVRQKERFRSEAAAVAQLNHPHIISVYEVGEEDGRSFFAMELFDGADLAQHISDFALDNQSAARIVLQIAQAVECAHQRNIIHRDLKPANVLIDSQHSIKVTDFGLAKHLESDQTQTMTGQIMGTPSFMSPEQAAGKPEQVDHRTDIYSLGATLYACLTGRPPFKGNSLAETLSMVQTTEPIRPRQLNRQVHRDLETICLKCLEKSPARRYNTAREVEEELSRFLDGAPIKARPVSRPARMVRWCRRHPAMASMWAVVILLTFVLFTALPWLIVLNQGQQIEFQKQQRRTEQQVRVNDSLARAESSISIGAWADALTALDSVDQSLVDQDQRNAIGLDRVRCYHALGRSDQAKSELDALAKLDLNDEHQALLLLWQGDLALIQAGGVLGIKKIEQAVATGKLPPAEQNYAQAIIADNPADSIRFLNEAIRLDIYHHRANSLLYWNFVFAGRMEDALRQVERTYAKFPDEPNQFVLKTIVDLSRKRDTTDEMVSKIKDKFTEEEIEELLKTLQLFASWGTTMENWEGDHSFSNVANAVFAFARLTSSSDRSGESTWALKGQIRIPPVWQQVEKTIVTNMLLIQFGQYGRVADQLEQIIDDESPGDYWFIVGQCRFLEGEELKAEECFRKAISQPSRAMGIKRESYYLAAMSLAQHWVINGKPENSPWMEQAAYYARERSKLPFLKVHHMDQLCRVSFAGGDYETARFYADRLMLLDPTKVGTQLMDANIDLKLGHYAKAIAKATAIDGSEDREDVQAIIREAREALKKLSIEG